MPVTRPLPPRPSLTFDRKQAKTLLRQLRAANPEALARAQRQHAAFGSTPSHEFKLADAQLVIAREYGFSSWPHLVQYHEGVAHLVGGEFSHSLDKAAYLTSVERILRGHRQRHELSGRSLAAYVPRFFGLPIAEVFVHEVSEDEARLAVARTHGAPSWEVLMERADTQSAARAPERPWDVSSLQRATRAIERADLDELKRLVAAFPELLQHSRNGAGDTATLMSAAIGAERAIGRDAVHPIIDWLTTQGQDLHLALNQMLRLGMWLGAEGIQWLIGRGADPKSVGPDGLTVLEHALLMSLGDHAVVDVIAAHVVPPRAFWVACGLGDVDVVARYLDRNGRPTPAARRRRPPLGTRRGWLPQLPDADDEEILLEGFAVALLNSRTQVMAYLTSRGFNVNTLRWGTPLVHLAVGNAWTDSLECLVACGADLDLRGWASSDSARERARAHWEQGVFGPRYRRIVELCGLDPDATLAARDARPLPVPVIDERLQGALHLAALDAHERGASDVGEEHLLFGLLRGGRLAPLFFAKVSGMDRERFSRDHAMRLRAAGDVPAHAAMERSPQAQSFVDDAIVIATERRRDRATDLHLLEVLLRDEQGVARTLLARYGGDAPSLMEELRKA